MGGVGREAGGASVVWKSVIKYALGCPRYGTPCNAWIQSSSSIRAFAGWHATHMPLPLPGNHRRLPLTSRLSSRLARSSRPARSDHAFRRIHPRLPPDPTVVFAASNRGFRLRRKIAQSKITASVLKAAPFRRALTRAAAELLNLLLIALGILSASMGLHGFLLSSNFIDGGVTGVSMLVSKVTGTSLSVWLPVFNLPFIALGWRQIGPAFAFRSALAIAGLSITLAVVHFPDVTPDLVLTAVFGGFFIGAGIGLAVRGGAVLDGTEIAALLISKRSHPLKVGDVILLFYVVLFVVAMSLLGVEEALYSILTYVAAADRKST